MPVRFKILFLLPLLVTLSCKQKSGNSQNLPDKSQQIKDAHSLSNADSVAVQHLNLNIKVDFAAQQISGKATWEINNLKNAKEVVFDTRGLTIQKVTAGDEEKATKYFLGDEVKFLGRPLHVALEPSVKKVNIYYATAKDAGALQWLTPQQTAQKKKPFLFTQSESILARTWVPCQDGPGVRFTYEATVTVPADLLAVMSAENPQQKNDSGIYHFKQTHSIPSYLLALAVGDLAFKAIDNRTGIYAEPVILQKAAWEFADMGKMVNAAEKLYGPYQWGRYDVLVLPPSFPFGGMENPNLTFATPTVIAGDRSLVSLVAHELAHSWSGNLVTNATWNDMWLNEGFTTYFERRIIEAVYGKEEAKMQEALGRQTLEKDVADLPKNDTKLKGEFNGRDPDDAMTNIPYEKGYAFLRTIEEAVGREKFDKFLRSYFDKHAFQSRSTEQFIADLRLNLISNDKALEEKIGIDKWVYEPGIPSNAPPVGSAKFTAINTLIANFRKTGIVAGMHKQVQSANELLYFITHLPADLTSAEMAAIDKEFKFTQSGNSEVQSAWYTLCIRHQYKAADPYIENFLMNVGRRKFIVPLYSELIKTPEGKKRAKDIYAQARQNYHPVAYGTLDQMLK